SSDLSMWWSLRRATCTSMETISVWCTTPLSARAGPSMPPDASTPGSPEDWLRHARSDLALAQQRGVPEILKEAEEQLHGILRCLGPDPDLMPRRRSGTSSL